MRDEVRYRRAIEVPGLVLGTARFSAFRFEPHCHLDWHVGLIAAGVRRQSFKGESLLLTRGTVQQLIAAGRGGAITDIAHAVGFFDQSHFTRAFRDAYGVTPARCQRPAANFLQGDPASRE